MNLFLEGLARYMDRAFLRYLDGVRVGIIGAGGLGSNCAAHLVRSGFTDLIIADHDSVDASNLNRQYYRLDQVGRPKVTALRDNLLAINPDARIHTYNRWVDRDSLIPFFDGCDLIVEAVDEAKNKKIIVETFMPRCTVVSASGMGGFGVAGNMQVRRIGNLIQVGDFSTACTGDNPPLAPGVAMAAALQADVILNHFHELWRNHDRT